MLSVDTGLAEGTCDDDGCRSERGNTSGNTSASGSGWDEQLPVIDTTSAEVELKADGKQRSEHHDSRIAMYVPMLRRRPINGRECSQRLHGS